MPRPLRVQLAGGIFHVTARGNRKQEVFLDDVDRHTWLDHLAEVVERYGWRCHAYCLMPNHFHLVIETREPNLSAGMQRLNAVYAQWFNARHAFTGHLFQGRFHSTLVESNWHLLELLRYVVLNPTRAGLCDGPAAWAWSSYLATIARAPRPRFLTVGFVLSQFGEHPDNARTTYELFVRDAAPRPPP
jgi:putative transposase